MIIQSMISESGFRDFLQITCECYKESKLRNELNISFLKCQDKMLIVELNQGRCKLRSSLLKFRKIGFLGACFPNFYIFQEHLQPIKCNYTKGIYMLPKRRSRRSIPKSSTVDPETNCKSKRLNFSFGEITTEQLRPD